MQLPPQIFWGLAILGSAFALARRGSFQRLKGWQKLLGVVAVIVALFIVLNPELLALGLLGDAAFFDALVLLISLQLQTTIVRVGRGLYAFLSGSLRWLRIPSPGTYYLLVISSVAIGAAISTIQKFIQRISS
jgi:hypothetical protein